MAADAKAKLRTEMRARRDALDAHFRAQASRTIAGKISSLPRFRSARRIALFASFGSEVDTWALETAARQDHHDTCYPKIMPNGELAFFLGEREDMFQGPMGILEPSACSPPVEIATLEVLVVPGLAFDAAMNRLGYGKGFYDRVLAKAPRALKIGIAFDTQVVDEVPAGPSDVKVDLVATETRLLKA